MTISPSAQLQPAPRPSTDTDSTESPAKSRSKRDSPCVARANIVARPDGRSECEHEYVPPESSRHAANVETASSHAEGT
jgi:hypothetical protein